ncbi:flagellar basal body rod protein FlgC [Legionella micdadei]|uniref:Flagellar basal-body rod protein FlgC n=1 Tax=Legionella micdadei TaxID=451 RepID=A0A098GGN1_LEGMI|nr:flagellar basal body rod protein FlgC [Legionella micdadei]ARG96965.1 flagellar basal body rod protein FlgC [Legionella micdadei]ARH00780.1 flagellar basal body rod protein FlgC [Legionella micdadei]KTD26675.1 flagellar basal body rod protein FlgC [Legionella micdadei]NSL19480.1 flagellar basal body rod protein FlgC [Legionella micdadei]CEG61628.1 Flagellar basal-body rod protein FlgC [Legionella micdadei]
MNYDQIYAIAGQGMRLEKLRVDVVANNIANQHSLQNADGTLFQPMQVLATAIPFSDYLGNSEEIDIATIELVPQTTSPNKVYQPGHPAADKQGYVSYPGISMVDEMTTLLRASRSYEANIKIINAAHSLYLQALSIGEER